MIFSAAVTSCRILQEDPELAVSELAKLGLVRAEGNRWLLSGEPPGELLELETINPDAEKQPA